MKKLISVLLCVVLAFSCVSLFTVTASASNSLLTINVKSNVTDLFPETSTTVNKDSGKVTVTYWLNTPYYNLLNCEFILTYDKTALTYDLTEDVNQKTEGRKTIPLILKSIVDDDSGSIAYNPAPDSYAKNTTTGAVLLNCTNKETYETSGGKKAFVSVTFKINPDASGSADVYLNVKTLGFLISDKTSNTPQYLVKKSAAVAGSTNMYVTDDSYAAAYEGDFNEAYIPMVVDDTLKITTSLTLWMNLKVTYYVKKELIGTMTDPYVTVKFGDVNEKIDGVLKTENGIEYYTFEYNGVCPQRMYDQYEVTVFASDNGILHYHTETKGVASYIYEGFDYDPESFFPVYVDLLNYGSAAQVQMNYHADSLVNEKLANYQKLNDVIQAENQKRSDLVANNYMQKIVTEDSAFPQVSDPSVTNVKINLTLDNSISMNYKFNLDNPQGTKVRIRQYANNNGARGNNYKREQIVNASDYVQGTDQFIVSYKGMSATEMRDLVYFTVLDSNDNPIGNTTRFSIESEIALCRQDDIDYPNNAAIKKLLDLEETMLLYGDTSKTL